MKSGNLNFLEPSGPLQACNGTDLPLEDVLKLKKILLLPPSGLKSYSEYTGHFFAGNVDAFLQS